MDGNRRTSELLRTGMGTVRPRDGTLYGLLAPALGILAFVALTAFGARLVFQREPVPVTLQVYFVLLSGMALGSRVGALSQVAYVGLGLAGAPVFASPPYAGVGYLIGPTGGYLVGFIAAAFLTGFVIEHRAFSKKKGMTLIAYTVAGITGLAAIYALGFAWLVAWMMLGGKGLMPSLAAAWAAGVAPFLALDALKAVAAGVSALGAGMAVTRFGRK